MRDDSSGTAAQAAAIEKELCAAFASRGAVGGTFLSEILNLEDDYANTVLAIVPGYWVLMDSFHDFFIQTLSSSGPRPAEKHGTEHAGWYPRLGQYALSSFRRFRAGDVLLRKGYPLLGYSLLRDLKDAALGLAALAAQETSVRALEGLRDGDVIEDTAGFRKRLRKQRVQEEKRIRTVMLGEDSGLDEATREQLRRWQQLFDVEVHGSRLSMTSEGRESLRGKRGVSIGPCPDEGAISVFANASRQVAWMHLKTFPVLQLKPHTLTGQWEQKWRLLDEAFRFHMHCLGGIGRPVADAIIKLVDAKFDFDLGTHYAESE